MKFGFTDYIANMGSSLEEQSNFRYVQENTGRSMESGVEDDQVIANSLLFDREIDAVIDKEFVLFKNHSDEDIRGKLFADGVLEPFPGVSALGSEVQSWMRDNSAHCKFLVAFSDLHLFGSETANQGLKKLAVVHLAHL